jgi:hypothetical protein
MTFNFQAAQTMSTSAGAPRCTASLLHLFTVSLSLAVFAPLRADAVAPTPNDYSRGLTIDAPGSLPMIELPLPDAVYHGATHADLGDVRVFNAEGAAVPHGFCDARATSEPQTGKALLPVFPLSPSQQTTLTGAHINVRTATGTQVQVQEPGGAATPPRGPEVHIIDARGVMDHIRAVEFTWESPDGASEVRVSIEASEDLDRWTTIVPASTLLQVTSDGRVLRRSRIALPERSYSYLRVERSDNGPPLRLEMAAADTVAVAEEIEPQWFTANVVTSNDSRVLLFDTERVAPVQYARILLPQENSSFRAKFSSRSNEKAPWVERWSGEIYLIATNGQRRRGPPAHFTATTDRYWRVEVPVDTTETAWPPLELGYRPLTLRFLAQGTPPYTLAFGSRRASSVPRLGCEQLVGDLGVKDRENLVAQANPPGPVRTLGGEEALQPVPEKTPVRQIVLWTVLIAGVGLLVAMAMSLLRRLKTTE